MEGGKMGKEKGKDRFLGLIGEYSCMTSKAVEADTALSWVPTRKAASFQILTQTGMGRKRIIILFFIRYHSRRQGLGDLDR